MSKPSGGAAQAVKLIAEAYSWEESGSRFRKFALEKVEAQKRYRLTEVPQGAALASGKLKVNRIVLYPEGGGSTPLVADVLPAYDHPLGNDRNSGIELEDNNRKAKINFAVRSVWYRFDLTLSDGADREAVIFEIELDAGDKRDYKTFKSPDLDDEKLVENFQPPLASVLNGAWRTLENSGKDPKIGRTLGLKMLPNGAAKLAFKKPKSLKRLSPDGPLAEVEEPFYAVEFSADIFNNEKSDAQLLRGFNQSFIANRHNRGRKVEDEFPDADELIVFEKDQPRPNLMTGRQLASEELSLGAPPNRRPASVVIIEGIPSANAVQVWNRVTEGFHSSLRDVRAGNKVSFLPRFQPERCQTQGLWAVGYHLRDAINGPDPDYIVEGNRECEADEPEKCAKYTAFGVWPLSVVQLCVSFPGIFDEARRNLETDIIVTGPSEGKYRSFQKRPGLFLSLRDNDLISFDPERSVRFGAIDLRLGPKRPGHQIADVKGGFFEVKFERDLPDGQSFPDERFEIRPPEATDPTTPPEARRLGVHLRAFFNVAEVLPGGQDAPASDEFILNPALRPEERSPEFSRDSPITVPWHGKKSDQNNRLFLIVDEQSDRTHTDSITVQLNNQKLEAATAEQKLVVIDPDPFSIVAVRFTPFNSRGNISQNQSNTVGYWINGPGGARWILQSLNEDFSLVLPPQVVGEEMQRHRTIAPGSPINFRFSQPTTIRLGLSGEPRNFQLPPWNLRRILEPEAADSDGPRVTFMQYELLYGLSCEFETKNTNVKNLRLMEIFRRFGRIPGALPKVEGTTADPAGAWAKLFRQYRARIGVFVPWEPGNQQSLILNEGVRCVLRRPGDGANWAHPLDTDDVSAPPAPHEYRDLRGGATWGFESRNVFTAVLNTPNQNGELASNTARLINPQFSSLGGWGSVKATFDNERSAIYGDAAMGRTFSYTLERIGRIACFWNKAKHVIVYERHVAPSRQFVCTQEGNNELTGLPLLRKTHEYVEILEDKRTYPESPASPAMQRGFVKGCYFTKGQRINVDSLWGGDVGTHGWRVPLWNPAARRDVYPKPPFSIGVESDVGGRSAECPCQCDNPENVFFYTSTDPKLSADTDTWPAVADVDYVNLPLPEPSPNDYPEGNLTPVFPEDPPVAPGFSICTFRVAKPTSPTNLVAERAGKPLSTVLQNVSMMRASVRQAAAGASQGFANLQNLGRETAQVYADVFGKLPETTEESAAAVRERLKGVIDSAPFKGRLDALRSSVKDVEGRVRKVADDFFNRVIERENQILNTMGARLADFVRTLREEYDGILEHLLRTPGPNLNALVLAAVDRMFQKVVDTLFMVPLSSNILRRQLGAYRDAAAELKRSYDEHWNNLKTTVNNLQTIGAADRRRLLEMIERADSQIRGLIAGLRLTLDSFRAQLPEPWVPEPKQLRDMVQTALRVLDGYGTALEELRQAVNAADKAMIIARAESLLSIAKNALEQPLASLEALVGDRDKIRDDMRAKLIAWVAAQQTCAPGSASVHCQLREKVTAAGNDVARLRQTAAELNRLLSDEAVKAKVSEFKGVINAEEAKLRQLAAAYTAHLVQDVTSVLGRLDQTQLKQEIDAAVQSAAAAFGELSRRRRELLDQVNRVYEDNYRSLQEARDLFQSADNAVRLVRAFGSPPAVPNLAFDRPEVAFFYKESQRFVDVTPVLARVNQAQQAADALKALGVRVPTKQLLEDLVPQALESFDLRKIFPDFAGLKLENLFPGLKMPKLADDRVRVSHGADVQTRRAWVQAEIRDVRITTPSTLFAIGPVELSVPKASFNALTRFEGGLDGGGSKRQINARIKGDWEVKISGQALITFRDTELSFDDAEGLKFRIQPSRIQLNGILTFVSDLLEKFGGKDSGLSFGLLPEGGIQCTLKLPLPPVQFGAFGISNLNLGALLALRLNDPHPAMGGGFTIELGFNLGRKLAPFALTVFLLGGGGYFEVSARYAPGNGRLRCSVSLGVTVSASLAISLGPIHGGVYIYFGITAEFEAGGGARLAIGVMLLMRGEVSLLGIVEACISILLEAQYDTTSGQIIGRGQLSISIKICWCFTLEIEEEITYTVGEGNQSSGMLASHAAGGGPAGLPALPAQAGARPTYEDKVRDYVNMLA